MNKNIGKPISVGHTNGGIEIVKVDGSPWQLWGFHDYIGNDEHTRFASRCSLVETGQYQMELRHYSGDHNMTLIIPDRDRPQRDDFVWAVPAQRSAWTKWYELAEKFRGITPNENMRYMNRFDKGKIRTVLVLPTSNHSDDDVLAACAWLRFMKDITCKIYVLRCDDDPPSMAKIIERAAGIDASLMEEVQEGDERGTDKDGKSLASAED